MRERLGQNLLEDFVPRAVGKIFEKILRLWPVRAPWVDNALPLVDGLH